MIPELWSASQPKAGEACQVTKLILKKEELRGEASQMSCLHLSHTQNQPLLGFPVTRVNLLALNFSLTV